MNLAEFKAWFDGFTENLDGPPGPKAWERICARVKEIKPDPTPWPQFVKEYIPYYPTWPQYYPVQPYVPVTWTGLSNVSCVASAQLPLTPTMAFNVVGQMDAQEIVNCS